MPTYVALLRGINVGKRNRVAMADLRALLDGLGYDDVRTHLQSGNAVFATPTRSARTVEKDVEKAIKAELGLDIRVLVRSAAQLGDVVAADPLGDRASDPSRYLVVFCEKPVPRDVFGDLEAPSYAPEEFAAAGHELFLWLPKGVYESRLVKALTEKRLGGASTMRNWRTVAKLAELASS